MSNIATSLRPEWDTISQDKFRKEFRDLSSLADLAKFWKIPAFQISYHAFHSEKHNTYSTFFIPRRNGRKRRIEQPSRALKYIQRIVHESLTRVYGAHPAVHGFVAGRSIVTNARNHLGRRYVLNIDLADFFPSITRQRIYGRLRAEPYSLNSVVANVIASLSTNIYGQLPQGSPSSPVIANIITAGMDADLAELCGSLNCWYTRYADDITISTSRREMSPKIARYPNARGTGQVIVGDELATIIEKHGFKLNDRKSRLQSYWTRQMCTGLIVNGEQLSVPRSFIRHLRSLIHHWKMNGWEDAIEVLNSKEHRTNIDTRQKLEGHIIGKINYMKMVRGQNDLIAQRFAQIVASIPKGS